MDDESDRNERRNWNTWKRPKRPSTWIALGHRTKHTLCPKCTLHIVHSQHHTHFTKHWMPHENLLLWDTKIREMTTTRRHHFRIHSPHFRFYFLFHFRRRRSRCSHRPSSSSVMWVSVYVHVNLFSLASFCSTKFLTLWMNHKTTNQHLRICEFLIYICTCTDVVSYLLHTEFHNYVFLFGSP